MMLFLSQAGHLLLAAPPLTHTRRRLSPALSFTHTHAPCECVGRTKSVIRGFEKKEDDQGPPSISLGNGEFFPRRILGESSKRSHGSAAALSNEAPAFSVGFLAQKQTFFDPPMAPRPSPYRQMASACCSFPKKALWTMHFLFDFSRPFKFRKNSPFSLICALSLSLHPLAEPLLSVSFLQLSPRRPGKRGQKIPWIRRRPF